MRRTRNTIVGFGTHTIGKLGRIVVSSEARAPFVPKQLVFTGIGSRWGGLRGSVLPERFTADGAERPFEIRFARNVLGELFPMYMITPGPAATLFTVSFVGTGTFGAACLGSVL